MKSFRLMSGFVCVILILELNLNFVKCDIFGSLVHGLLNIPLSIISTKNGSGSLDSNNIQNVETTIPFLTKLKDINKFSSDIMHGDYVGASLDGVDFLETFDNLKWPIKLFLKVAEKILTLIHPLYLAIFPRARNNGTFMDNLMFSVSHGEGMVKSVLKIISIFQ